MEIKKAIMAVTPPPPHDRMFARQEKSITRITPNWFSENTGGRRDKWAYASFKQIDDAHYWLIKHFPFTIT